jgi:hypothetical protein
MQNVSRGVPNFAYLEKNIMKIDITRGHSSGTLKESSDRHPDAISK